MFSGVIIYLILQTPSLHSRLKGSPSPCLFTGIWLADLWGDFELDKIHNFRHLEHDIIPVFVNTN